MKFFIRLSIVLIFFSACKEKQNTYTYTNKDLSKTTTSIYPERVTKVFKAHGGIDQWNKMKTLSFSIEKSEGNKITTVNLTSRSELIENPYFTLGYDGNILWINEKDNHEYKGNAWFYKGLFSYFYAMPFIVGDNGVVYEKAEPLLFEGKTYPGILISYEANVGVSPDDQYIIYYDSETNEMEWLAYTVTFGEHKKNDNYRLIKYTNWQNINGLKMPKHIDWYSFNNNRPLKKQNTIEFKNVNLSQKAPKDSLFVKPINAEVIPLKVTN